MSANGRCFDERARTAAASWFAATVLAGCATQPAYVRPTVPLASQWDNGGAAAAAVAPDARWWTALHDPAIDGLAAAALLDNPTLGKAVARMDEARATVGVDRAALFPQITASGSATRAQSGGLITGTTTTVYSSSSASLGPSLSWELDLWGKLRETLRASAEQLDARTADAESARLSLIAELAGDVLDLRACRYSLSVRDSDIASRETELTLTRLKLKAGSVAPVDVSNAESNLESARTSRISQAETCAKDVDALVELSGQPGPAVRAYFPEPPAPPHSSTGVPAAEPLSTASIPTTPLSQPALPATVLLNHPDVRSAERELAAAWSDIAVARAKRLPTLDLSAALDGNWLSAFGSTVNYLTYSFGPSFSTPLLDGGSGAANVRKAQATYREDLAALRLALRTAAQNVEDALASQASAEGRMQTTARGLVAARATLLTDLAKRRAGSTSQFELEDARRTYTSAQESQIEAARDNAKAWVNLIKATGGAVTTSAGAAQADASVPSPPATLTGVSGSYVHSAIP